MRWGRKRHVVPGTWKFCSFFLKMSVSRDFWCAPSATISNRSFISNPLVTIIFSSKLWHFWMWKGHYGSYLVLIWNNLEHMATLLLSHPEASSLQLALSPNGLRDGGPLSKIDLGTLHGVSKLSGGFKIVQPSNRVLAGNTAISLPYDSSVLLEWNPQGVYL